ncbi:unnamed protein product [Effrenium voratum]|uniref:Uncharacterized protein n=1 Tax=Effrenium voratum TaxID=2562239 RepID=A0AA36NAM8_9DINO|nr:unnamed protein product [Effrenium voratum]
MANMIAVALAVLAAGKSNKSHEETGSAAACVLSKPVMQSCGSECFSNSDLTSCSADCLQQKGESFVCAQCYGPKIQCSIEKCMDKCSDEFDLTGDCQVCVMQTCSLPHFVRQASLHRHLDAPFLKELVAKAKATTLYP